MKQLNEHHSFTGMQRDMSIAKHPSSFLYDAHNIRLTARGEDTLLTITNERGPSYAGVEIKGTYLGHCLLGKYLTVFSTGGLEEDDNTLRDYITRIDLSTKESVVLYKGNLKFDTNHLIETIGSYENDYIQKVYWTDGKNQPRLINIVDDNIRHTDCDTQFDFIRELSLQEDVTIQKQLGSSGSFAPGVIQYAFTYYNKHGQETNIFYTSPLLYISHKDRGASPEDKVENAFKITIRNIDKSFDYIRIYSIQRTSINAVPIVKRVQDISTKYDKTLVNNTITYAYNSRQGYYNILTDVYENGYNNVPSDYPPIYQNLFHVCYSSGSGPDSTAQWYRYKKEYHPYLEVKTPFGMVTWGPNSTDNSVMWVSINNIEPGDYNPPEGYTGAHTPEYETPDLSIGPFAYYVIETSDETGDIGTIEEAKVKSSDHYDISFLDTGTTGDIVDPTELLYKGGESIKVQTIDQKDGTLFLGNIETERKLIDSTLKTKIQRASSRRTYPNPNNEIRIFYPTVVSKGDYVYHNQLTSYSDSDKTKSVPCGGFKRGDYYRCGVQFQYKDGRWSDPVFLNDEQVLAKPSLDTDNDTISVPVIKYTMNNANNIITDLYNLGYRKIRPVVVFPSIQDRVTICQGVANPTLSFVRDVTLVHDVIKTTKGQSSWFFRPKISSYQYIHNNSTVSPLSTRSNTHMLEYADAGVKKIGYISGDYFVASTNDPKDFRAIEIQGHFENEDQFVVDLNLLSLHSPDIEFDDSLYNLNFEDTKYRKIGEVSFYKTFSDINIQTETPQVSNSSLGFIHKEFTEDGSYGIVSGLFYEDFCINDEGDAKIGQWYLQKSSFEWVVYPWQRNGSLNNDITRPADKGTATSVLKKKVISNLRYANTTLDDSSNWSYYDAEGNSQIYSDDQPTIIKVNGITYQGNIDTSLYPSKTDGMYYAFRNSKPEASNIENTSFNIPFDEAISQDDDDDYYPFWRTLSYTDEDTNDGRLWRYDGLKSVVEDGITRNYYSWVPKSPKIADDYIQLVRNKQAVRMRYKSTPHLVINTESGIAYNNGLPIIEVVREGDSNNSFYRSTMFGGTTEDALKANQWIPCGEPVIIPPNMPTGGDNKLYFEYSYGDTYFQRWDCLKTYPFSNDDINQIVEIGSFMLETKVNIDGRYDRNRGQVSNLNMSPINFNLFNPVYNQTDNFFTYRILDESYYKINKFPNQITWTKEKKAGADIDLWTNITLASTYDMDGSKGEVRAIRTWQDNIYCFQDLGISNILFNSRVQIPTSDGVPIEISNSYKVDGYRYISDGIGCTNKWTISNAPSGLYFADTKTNHLHHIGSQGIQDVTTIHNMTSWFNNVDSNRITKTLHDDVNHDLYALTSNESICYSEVLGNFTSFMSYQGISLIESYENSVYTMKDGKLYSMFTGEYSKFFSENYEPWDFTFISNGIDNNLMDFDKVYSTIDYRMDMSDDTDYKHDNSLDVIRVYNEYQDTGNTDLIKLKVIDDNKFLYHKDITLRKKFRIWRIQIPRAIKSRENSDTHETEYYRSNDRIRNTWCKIKLGSKGKNNYKAVLHDLNVQYYL